MTVFLFWALLVVLVLGGAYLMLRRRTDAMAARERDLERPETETLRYTLPPGQDPAIVLAALQRGGFAALSPATSGAPHVIIECPQGREQAREPARKLL